MKTVVWCELFTIHHNRIILLQDMITNHVQCMIFYSSNLSVLIVQD